jgi:ParB-like chromosome segregation protein Spo0J
MGKHYVSPVYNVIQVPLEKIQANSYNPNKVSPPEMKLLIKSILEDGYTMPIVCYYLPKDDRYEIVDGFHRYLAMKTTPEIAARENSSLPVSVIDKPLSERIASTIRHNRARGVHAIDLMVDIVAQLVEAGLSDEWIMKNIGMDPDEILRLKQISGLASLFADREFSRAWRGDKPPRNHVKFEDGEEYETIMSDNFF